MRVSMSNAAEPTDGGDRERSGRRGPSARTRHSVTRESGANAGASALERLRARPAVHQPPSTTTSAAPPSRAARASRQCAMEFGRTPARITSAKPVERSSTSAHSRASRSPDGRSRMGPGGQDAPAITRAPSTQAARSPWVEARTHAPRSSAVAPPPARQRVRRPRGRPPEGRMESRKATPVGTVSVVPYVTGRASGKRCSSRRRSSRAVAADMTRE